MFLMIFEFWVNGYYIENDSNYKFEKNSLRIEKKKK